MLLDVNGKLSMEKSSHFSCRKVLLLTHPYCQFLGVSLGIKQTFFVSVVSSIVVRTLKLVFVGTVARLFNPDMIVV